jgi:putative glutamine transport system substrate-binding protein
MKGISVLVLGVVLSAVVAACSGGAAPAAPTTAPAASPKSDTKAAPATAAASPAVAPKAAASPAASPAAKTAASPAPSPAAKTAASPAASPATKAASPQAATGPLPMAAAGTALRRVQDQGKIVVGVKYDVPTFGYLNPRTNQLEGFDVDISKGIARHIFGDPTKIEFKQAISRDRIPFLDQGVVDLIASTMTINEERTGQIDFSIPYYVAGQSLLVPRASTVTGVRDLAGKTVATVKGSTSEQNIQKAAPNAQIVLFDTYSEGVAAMDSGRADAVTTDDIILYGFVKESPDKYKVVGGQFTIEPYGIGAKKGSPELIQAVNAALVQMYANGEWAEIYRRNLPGSQVPPVPPQNWRDIRLPG